MIQRLFLIDSNEDALQLFGQNDRNLLMIEDAFDVRLAARGNQIVIMGDDIKEVETVHRLLKELSDIIEKGNYLTEGDLRYAIQIYQKEEDAKLSDLHDDIIQVTYRGKKIRPKTKGQKRYVDAIRKNDIVFGIGPAGTGKTYLAMVMAVNALLNRRVSRIILTRPAIEAGERLGFLPGDLQRKVDPYLRPLYDALYDILGSEKVQQYLDKDIIEVAPLAYMRGRTLDDCFVIMDEAQNTTPEQMKMFLTRLGYHSKAVVTGDITQIDLPRHKKSGLALVQNILKNISGIEFVYLTGQDVVRHRLVQEILNAYEEYEKRAKKSKQNGR
ncbi:phosphate starvation-inducible protein PhoH [Anoxybacter fermentans]|uniref:PhoH-like protein n=1 Tax=Anoxybacter fermentans TaxID=1323375 RepID=A0A3S9SXT6_9FIRM|nr:phosphate starvation-inducible protein PhoH [Anoxybacter fermentans]